MSWVLNALFWLFMSAVLLCGSYLLFFQMGTLLTEPGSTGRGFVRPLAVVLSVVLTPAALGLGLLLFRQRGA